MTVAEVMRKMIAEAGCSHHDINHFMKVWAFARTIGELEKLPPETQYILEVSAIVHDIACPLCREKYGSAPGTLQEKESPALIAAFFRDTDLTAAQVERVNFLVSHHHTYVGVDGPDYRILLEADYLVNADESGYSKENIVHAREMFFRTAAGTQLLNDAYGV